MASDKSLDDVCDLLTGISSQLTHINTQLDSDLLVIEDL